ncbi:MAG TPA: L,D-transpeptidase family protein [Rhizomicrobium sp.]|nr:L,D-transpeptidase family protein [Rhizomicrobium sp.]
MPLALPRLRRWIVAWFAAGVVSLRFALAASAEDTQNYIHDYLSQPSLPGVTGGELNALRTFYSLRGDQPAWTGSTEAESDGQILQAILAQAASEGLNPADYRIIPMVGYGAATAWLDAEKDVLETNAALRYANDLRDGRAWLRELDDDVEMPPHYFDAVRELSGALQNRSLTPFLASLAPTNPQYVQLKALLARYQSAITQGGWRGTFSKHRDGREELRRRLSFEDDSVATADNLTDALTRFQEHHGLDATGVLNAETRAALNVSATQRAAQVEANMERWRWMPRGLEHRYVMVNVPDASLEVIADGNRVLASPVIVGKPEAPTPILRADAVSVTVNPPWLIPPKIARREILPKLHANPGYLREHNMVWRANGAGLEQRPGGKNALGRIKLELPNRFDVYLHDTPGKKLFAHDDRDLSHGCVRVEKILPLASYALTGDDSSVSLLTSAVATGKTRRFPLSEPLPIYIVYWTVFVDADGSVEFRPDVYDRDQRLIEALENRPQRMTSL